MDLYAYCNNNPVMRQDPTGHAWWKPSTWNWGLITDVAVSAAAIVAGAVVGVAVTVATGNVAVGVGAGVATTGVINNTVNAIYYNHISDGQSTIDESGTDAQGDPVSHYVNNGYITRWERLDYAKHETKDSHYNINAWRFYSEYNFHMYMWFATGWTHEKNIPLVSGWANSARHAGVLTNDWERDTETQEWSWRNLIYIAVGLLGF